MANKKLSELPVVTTLRDNDIILALANGSTSTINIANLKALISNLTQGQKEALALITSNNQEGNTVVEIGGVSITSKTDTTTNERNDTVVTEIQRIGSIIVTTVTTTKASDGSVTTDTTIEVNGEDISTIEETTRQDVDTIFAELSW